MCDRFQGGANDKIRDKYKYPYITIQVAPNQKQKTNKVGLGKILKVKIGNKCMLTVDSYPFSQILGLLINGKTELVCKKYVNFSGKESDLKAMGLFSQTDSYF